MHLRHPRISSLFVAVFSCALMFAGAARAGVGSWDQSKYASLVVDGSTGAVITQKNAGKARHPASLTKLMTLYVTFLALEKNKLNMNEHFAVSQHAASRPPSKLFLKAGSTISVRDLINAVAIKSANDAASVLAEGISGSEPEFAKLMTKVASHLGMKQTKFRNASGLHDPAQVTTAYDMARLAIALKRDFPQYYFVFNKDSFTYKGQTYFSHNNVAKNYDWADGLKTGYVNASGFNLVTSAYKNNKRLIGVVLGGRTANERDNFMVSMLNNAFGDRSVASNSDRIRVNSAAAASLIASSSGGYDAPTPMLKPQTAGYSVASAALDEAEREISVKRKPALTPPAAPQKVAYAAARPVAVASQYRPAAVTVLANNENAARPIAKPQVYAVKALPAQAPAPARVAAPRSPFVTPEGPAEVAAYYADNSPRASRKPYAIAAAKRVQDNQRNTDKNIFAYR